MADDALTMPPAYVGENPETEDQRRLRLAGTVRPDLLRPPTDLSPPALPGTPLTMPPAGIPSAQQSAKAPATPSVMPPAGPVFPGTPAPGSLQPESSPNRRAQLLPDDGQPLGMPPARVASPQPHDNAAPAPSEMPPARISGTPPPGSLQPESSPNGPAGMMPPAQVPVPKPEFGNVNAPPAQPPELHGWRKYIDSIGSIFPIGRAIETAIPGTPQNWEMKQAQQAERTETGQRIAKGKQDIESSEAKAQFETPEKRRAYMEQNPDEFQGISDFEKNDFILQGKFPQGEGALAGKTPEETTIHDLMTGDNGNPRVNPDTNKP